ncbi:MAG: hypothetical protein D3920_04305 [Candidatus Electrothrix sp. AW2]|nr:hypothetical protein [Candidatus Electrothrix gigas]
MQVITTNRKSNLFFNKSTVLGPLFALLVAASLLLSPFSAIAQPDKPDSPPSDLSDLDAVLEGFEEPTEEPTKESTAQVPAQEADELNTELDAILDGFGEEDVQDGEPDIKEQVKPSDSSWFPDWLSIDGWLQFGTTYNFAHDAPTEGRTDWRGFSKARTDLQLNLQARFSDAWSAKIGGKAFYDGIYSLQGREEYTSSVLDEYEDEVELREAYVQGKLSDKLDLTIGRQIVVWGKSDNIRITDVLNPLDMREPGMTDIEDLRLPLIMSKLDYYFGNWELSGIAVHEINFNKTPVYGYDFYPADQVAPPADEPESSLENTEWALSLSGIFTGWDLDLYYARVFNDTAHLEYVLYDDDSTEIRQKHERLHLFGFAYNKALGNWLLKGEGAVLNRVQYSNRPGIGYTGYTRFDALVGAEYSGFSETTLSLEFANRHINNHRPSLEASPDSVQQDMYQVAFRGTRDFFNDTMKLSVLVMLYGPSAADGAFERLALDYALTDTVTIRGGAVLYQTGNLSTMQKVGKNDRVFAELRYSF